MTPPAIDLPEEFFEKEKSVEEKNSDRIYDGKTGHVRRKHV